VPEQSAGGSLTQRPPKPRIERPALETPGAPTIDDSPGDEQAADDLAVDDLAVGDQQDVAQADGDRADRGEAAGDGDAGGQGGQAGNGGADRNDRLPPSRPPSQVTIVDEEPAARISPALDSWRRALAGSGMPDTLLATGPEAAASWLDLTHAHPSGLAQLFAARPTRLSSLFREPEAHAVAWQQVGAIRASAIVLSAQRGVQGSCLAIGVASWHPAGTEPDGRVLAPVVLRGCRVRPRGPGDDFDLDLDDTVQINPELIRELVDVYGIEADGAYLAALAQGEKGFDPRPVYAWLEDHCRALRAFTIERSLVLATFAVGSGAVLADLDAAVPAILAHRMLGRVAAADGPELLALDEVEQGNGDTGDLGLSIRTVPATDGGVALIRPGGENPVPPGQLVPGPPSAAALTPANAGESRRLAVIGRLGPRGTRTAGPPEETDPASELLVVDSDPAQGAAVAGALRGENMVIEGPPGSGATHTLAAAIAGLTAAGRRVLVLSPRRASADALLTRLEAAGIGDLVLDLRDSAGGRPATRSSRNALALGSSLAAATSDSVVALPKRGLSSEDNDLIETIRQARTLLDGDVAALHEVRQPWAISAYDAMVALCELGGRVGGPSSQVRLPDEVLARLDAVTRERLRVHLHAAANAGAFTLTRIDTRWYDAQVSTNTQARKALEAALVLRAGLERTRAAMDSVASAAGLRLASEARGWGPLLDVLLGVRTTVDSVQPQLYEQPLDEFANALAPRGLRDRESSGRGERRRMRRQAQSLVRPGVHVANLYDVVVTAGEQRQAWARLSLRGDGPRVVVGLTDAAAAVNRMNTALNALSDVFAGTPSPDLRTVPLDDLERRVFDLAGDTQGILGQPRRATLVDGLRDAGLGELVDDLHQRRVGPQQIDAEFDLVWWSSVRDSIIRADSSLSRHDPVALRRASRDLRQAEQARLDSGAALVRTAVIGRAAKAAAAHPEQVRILRQELVRDDRRPRMLDLVHRCGDVLAGLAPVWVMSPDTVAAALAPARPGQPPIVDTVVVDDAGHIGLPEVVAALARGAQVIVAGDRRRLAPPDGSASVIEALAPFAKVYRLDRDHRAGDGRMLVPLAPRYPEGWQLTPGTAVHPPLVLEAVPDGVAIPPPGEELPISSDAEVRRVVDLMEQHALRHPEESLVVVTLSERHAERIEEALRIEVPDRPVLGGWLAEQPGSGRAEPFMIRSVQRLLGVERDAAIISIGLARTPHGRVLHRFGVLDGDKGAAALTTAVSRARSRTTIVCCFTADDLQVDRLRTAGARLLRDVLLAAGGRGTASAGRVSSATDGLVTDLRDRLAAAGLPVQVRVGDGAWPLDIAVADPRVPGRMLVAVDIDGPAFASRPSRERERHRPVRWERAGWIYRKVSALDLFGDPALEVARIREAWDRAMAAPLPPDVYALTPTSVLSDVVSGPEDDEEPVLPARSKDDSDEGWNEQDADNRDEELRRDRPPHWD
jgi:hypothetical protein